MSRPTRPWHGRHAEPPAWPGRLRPTRRASTGGDTLIHSVGLWRPVLHRSRSDLPVVVAAWSLLVCAITLVAAATLYGEVVATGGLRQALLSAAPADRAILVELSTVADQLDATDAVITAELDDTLVLSGGRSPGSPAPARSPRPDRPATTGPRW